LILDEPMAVKRRVTSHEVAERAGVSRTTVSFVLNGVESVQISPETRQRVLHAARELGYVPDAAARSLASGQTRTLGLVICQPPDHIMVDAYLPQVVYGISEITREQGFRVLVESVEDINQPDAYLDLVRAKHIDGILLFGPRSDDTQIPTLIKDNFPLVCLGRFDQAPVHYVDADNQAAAYRATQHLIGLGHQRIACITNASPEYIGASERLLGYRTALENANLPYAEKLVRYGNFDPASGHAAMQSLLAVNPPPTAVFIASDVVAFGALHAIHQAGLFVPKDLAVVSFDDVPLARFMTPALTTIRMPGIEQGRRGVQMLISLINGEKPPEPQLFLQTELIIRQSCGAC
jgi:LacI family transcriptional regulator